MSLVVDSSIAAAWLLPDEQADVADAAISRVIEGGAHVPQLFHFEVANILLKSVRRRRIADEFLPAALAELGHLYLAQHSSAEQLPDVIALAGAYQLTAYDAAYLELARRLALPLATLDVDLANAARGAGVDLIGP